MSTPRFYTDGRKVWYITTIWRAAEGLPVSDVPIASIRELDQVVWFSDAWGKKPTCRAVIDHCVRIMQAEFTHPVILGPDGGVLDGMHRIAKAMLDGATTVRAVMLVEMPAANEEISPNDPRYLPNGS